MKRRSFIRTLGAVSVPFTVGMNTFTAVGRNPLFDLMDGDSDKVLVLIQLQGGNDGLSTLIPLDQYGALTQVRNNILMPENSILPLTELNGLHPAMGSMKEVWEKGKLNVVQSVAYPNQNRSHFRSTDIWNTASEPDEFLTSGWMGRYFDLNHSAFPEGYPNEENPDPFALTIGSIISETCQGVYTNYSMTVVDAFEPGSVNIGEQGEVPNTCYGNELTFIREMARQTNAYSEVISTAAEAGNNLSEKYSNENLSRKLQTVARLISGGLKTKVYVVQLGGFDLHGSMVDSDVGDTGMQADLLRTLSDAICAFQDDLELLGIDERVVGMTYSEFGRRIRSNESYGADHGTAAPLFVFGSCVEPGIIGDNPVINPEGDSTAGVPMLYDFRSVYASILMDWFSVSQEDVETVLFEQFQHLPIIRGCEAVGSGLAQETIDFTLYPNPASNYFEIELNKVEANQQLHISLFDVLGSELKVISSRKFDAGQHKIKVDLHDLVAGSYYLRVAGKYGVRTQKVVKQ